MNAFELYPITNKRRELCFKIIESLTYGKFICLRLYFLCEHFPEEKLDRAFEWLIANNVTGLKFIAWFTHNCSKSDLEMQRFLLQVVDNSKILVPLVAGKNFKV